MEDDSAVRQLLVDLLLDDGYDVRAAPHGQAALDLLETWTPGLIVLDMHMPVMDGQAFRRVQLSDGRWRDIPVLVISATHAFLTPDATFGAKAIIGKPFESDDLLELVDTWISRD